MSTPQPQIDWSRYVVKEPIAPDQQEPTPATSAAAVSSPATTIDWSQYVVGVRPQEKKPEPPPQESIPQYLGRQAARTGARAIETVLGFPGDVASLLQRALVGGAEKVAGRDIPVLRAVIGGEFPEEMKQKAAAQGYALPSPGLPTSQDVRGVLEKLGGAAVKPQTATEEKADDFTQTLTSLLTPGGVGAGLSKGFLRALGASALGHAAKEGAQQLGAGQSGQELAKLGGLAVASLVNPGGAARYTRQLYKKAEAALPEGAAIASSELERELSSLNKSLQKGVQTAAKDTVLRPIRDLLRKSKGGNVKIDELINARRDINSIAGDYTTQKGAKKLLGSINRIIDKSLKQYGKQNPEFGKNFFDATKAYETIETSRFLRRQAEKLVKENPFHAFGSTLVLHTLFPKVAAPVLGGTIALNSVLKTAFQYAKSPALRTHYNNLLRAGAARNTQEVERSLRALDRSALKDERAKGIKTP